MTLVPESDKAFFEEYKKQHIKDFFEYSQKSKSSNSIRAYRFAWTKFIDWCESSGYEPFSPPSCSHEFLVGLFMASMAKSRQLKPKSLESYLAGIKHFYAEQGGAVDTLHSEIRKAMSGIKREIGVKQNRKVPLTTDNIKMLIDSIQAPYGAIELRDKAMILLRFAGAFRRSELVGIDVEHLAFDPNGVSIFIPKSKTDQ